MTWVILTLVVVALLVVAAVVIEQQRSAALKRRFGPEYERAVEEHGDRKGAEAALRDRLKRRQAVELRALTTEAAGRYRGEWHTVQTRFVDDPGGAVAAARDLVDRVVADRGYRDAADADTDGDGRPDPVELVAIDHPHLVANYRSVPTGGAAASLDDLRATFVHYRELFDALVEDGTPHIGDGDDAGTGEGRSVRFGGSR